MIKAERSLSWRLFYLISQGRSLTQAAEECSIDPPYASRLLAKLEDELGFFLVKRKPRPIRLTEEGSRLLALVEEFVLAQKRLEDECTNIRILRHKAPKRKIRISLASNLNKGPVLERLALYERDSTHGVSFEFLSDRGLKALADRDTDISLGFYSKEVPDLSRFAIANYSFPLLGFSSYLEKYGCPKTLEELKNHHLLLRYKTSAFYSSLLIRQKAASNDDSSEPDTFDLEQLPNVLHGDSYYCREMFLKGVGIATDVALNFVKDEIAANQVFIVLPQWRRPDVTICLYCRDSDAQSPLYKEIMVIIVEEVRKIVEEDQCILNALMH